MGCGEDLIAVLDIAPERTQGVGGKMPLVPAERERILYLSPQISPPRLWGKDEEEIQALAQENLRRIEGEFKKLQGRSLRTVVINDVSLYLQAGRAEDLILSLEKIPTLVMNGYYGRYFGTSAFSRREREQMEILISHCDQVFYLPGVISPSL